VEEWLVNLLSGTSQ